MLGGPAIKRVTFIEPDDRFQARAFHRAFHIWQSPASTSNTWYAELFGCDNTETYEDLFPEFLVMLLDREPVDDLKRVLLEEMAPIARHLGRVVRDTKAKIREYVYAEDGADPYYDFFTKHSATKADVEFLDKTCRELHAFDSRTGGP
jgi:hypothetical protein